MNTTQETVAQQLERAAEIVGGEPWGATTGKPRIYMPSRRDATIYFEFPDSDGATYLGGACLKIFIDDCGQHPNWYAGQKRKIMASQRLAGLALCAFSEGDEELARAIAEADEIDEMAVYEQAANHLVNGRFAEARETLADWLQP